MVKKLFLSTLTGRLFTKRKDAQKVEDRFIQSELDKLDERAAKQRKRQNLHKA